MYEVLRWVLDATYNHEDRETAHTLQSCRSQKDRSQSNNQEGNRISRTAASSSKEFTSQGIIVKKGTGAEGRVREGKSSNGTRRWQELSRAVLLRHKNS